jgi:hypothetical protein
MQDSNEVYISTHGQTCFLYYSYCYSVEAGRSEVPGDRCQPGEAQLGRSVRVFIRTECQLG